jgi:ApaG protein
MYRAVTRDIQITVKPAYHEEQSSPAESRYFWSYTVEIVNLGTETVQLRSRHWQVRDGNGHVHEVRGDGVVGKQPVLGPGQRFEYTSGCPLETPQGIMSGTYGMSTLEGDFFDVTVPAFSLDSPQGRRVFH